MRVKMEIPELVPAADYKSKEAELKASIGWLLTKAYGRDIPSDYRQMFYKDDKSVEYIAPLIVQGLTRADIYCKASSNIFREKITAHGQGHQAVMQLLSRRGMYVTEGNDTAVTDSMLKQHKPVHLSAHMALIRALIKARTQDVVTVERVVKAVRSFTTFSASTELPCDTETTVGLWIKKVCSVMRARLELSEKQNASRARVPRKQVADFDKPGIPFIEDFMKDICDGCCLASLISFYCPDALRFQDIVMKESLNIADSLYNLQLVMLFAEQHLPLPCLHMTLNDIFYAPANLKPHMLMFVAELFHSFEIDPVKCVHRNPVVRHDPGAGDFTTEPAEGSPSTLRRFLPPGGISSATRLSFNNNAGGGGGSSSSQVGSPKTIPDRSGSAGPEARLLPRRLNQTKTALQNGEMMSSSPPKGATGNLSHSVRAWGESDQSVHPREGSADTVRTPLRGRASQQSKGSVTSSQQSRDSNSTLLANVSIDTSLDLSSDVSIDLSNDESTQFLQKSAIVNSVTSKPSVPARMQSDMELESISSRASAATSPGGSSRRDSQKEALTPAKLKPAKEKSNTHTKEVESGDIDSKGDSAGSTPEEYSTPSAENVVFVDSLRKRKPESSVVPQPTPVATSQQLRSHSGSSDSSSRLKNAQSFTVANHQHTPELAHAAGIPVVAQRRGSVNDRSSSDGSDQELHKIHADHRDHETKDSFFLHGSSMLVEDAATRPGLEAHRPTSLSMRGSPYSSGRVNARATPVGEGDNAGDELRLSLVEQFQRGKVTTSSPTIKKTTFAALPNQTTWQERALKKQPTNESLNSANSDDSDVQPLASELLSVRMRLVEQRRQIELGKQRAEMKWTKQREQLGKQAFIQVISRGKGNALGGDGHQEKADLSVESKQPVVQGTRKEGRALRGEPDEVMKRTPMDVDVDEKHHKTQDNDEPTDNARLRHRHLVDDVEEKRKESPSQQQWPNDSVVEKSAQRLSPERPKSCHLPEPDEASRREPNYPPLSMQSTALIHSSQENLQEYGTSLNKLNSSLTELQGEIMRLSLQQDRIKSAQASPSTTPQQQLVSVATSPVSNAASSSSSSLMSSQSYTQRQGIINGEPDVGGTIPSHQVASSFSQTGVITGATTVYSQVQMPYSHSYGTPPQYAHTQFPPQYVQGQMTMPAYPYPGMPGGPPPSVYSQPSTVYQPHPGTYPNMPGQLAWHMTPQPASHMQAPVSMVTTRPLSSYQPEHHMAHTYTVAAQNHHVLSPQRSEQPPPLNFAATYVAHRGSSRPVTPGTPPGVPVTPPGVCSPNLVGHGDSPSVQEEIGNFNNMEMWSSPDRPMAAPTESGGQTPKQKDGGFFITLDAGSPQKQKPKLGSTKRKDAMMPRTSSSEQTVSPVKEQVPLFSSPPQATPPKQDTTPAAVSASPSVGFVIGQDDSSAPDPSDLEKKRERFIEQQMRRREEQDRRRLQLETDTAKKREMTRLKQEQSEQKKAEEKTRREAIFQQYLQKKAEQEVAEEGVVPRRHPTQGNRTARLAKRPKSQPPVSHDDRASHSSSHSSQEELYLHGRSPVLDLKPVPATTGGQSDFTPPFGGFTQRWPGTPDKTSRPGTDNNGSETGSNAPSQYSGPKLFVTPSQKSNRHIIINAISHRCLAGTVNQEVKNRVLEVISQSEAKHFLILFRDAGLQYRGLYTYNPEREEVFKIQGVGPKQLANKAIERFYKYNSGTKAFTEVASTKHLSATIDAVVLHNSMWQKKQVARKPPAGQY